MDLIFDFPRKNYHLTKPGLGCRNQIRLRLDAMDFETEKRGLPLGLKAHLKDSYQVSYHHSSEIHGNFRLCLDEGGPCLAIGSDYS
jgi:hypothetical protein